jgi:hypothetical protein
LSIYLLRSSDEGFRSEERLSNRTQHRIPDMPTQRVCGLICLSGKRNLDARLRQINMRANHF